MHMGGAKERIDVKMIAHPDQDQKEAHEELSRKFASFNAKDAQCSKQEDRQKLLAVIEAAFGDYKEFNRDVRHVFASRVSRDSGDSPGSRVGSSSFISRLRSHARVLTWSLWQAAPSPHGDAPASSIHSQARIVDCHADFTATGSGNRHCPPSAAGRAG